MEIDSTFWHLRDSTLQTNICLLATSLHLKESVGKAELKMCGDITVTIRRLCGDYTATIREQYDENALSRPLGHYSGHNVKTFTTIIDIYI